jgi:hypothetical protein
MRSLPGRSYQQLVSTESVGGLSARQCVPLDPFERAFRGTRTEPPIFVAFTTHDVLIRGAGLGSLLVDLAAQRIARLQQPARADRFADVTGPSIREISVVQMEASRDEE